MCLADLQTELIRKPAVSILAAEDPALPKLVKDPVCLDAFLSEYGSGQGSFWQKAALMNADIGITVRVAAAYIDFPSKRVVPIHIGSIF